MLTWNLGDLFEAVADAVPERTATIAGGIHLTYRELDDRADRLARVLAERGVAAGDHVALAMRNGHEYLEAMLACFKQRAVPINVNTRYTVAELTHLLHDADVALVVHDADLAGPIVEAAPGTPRLERGPTYEAALAAAPAGRLEVARSGDDRYVLYTGGTTGMPRGVVWRHEDLLFAALGGGNPGGDPVERPAEVVEHARRGRTRCLPASPFTHGTAHWTAPSTLLNGGTVIVDTRDLRCRPPLGLLADRSGDRARHRATPSPGPLADALAAEPRAVAVGRPARGALRRGCAVARRARRPARPAPVGRGRGRLRTSETGGQGQMPVWAANRRRRSPASTSTRTPPCSTTPADRRRPAAASSVASPAGAASRSATTATPSAVPRPSSSCTASGGPSRATSPGSRPTGRSPCSAGAPRRSTPAARRCSPRRWRWCSRRSRRCSTPSWSACPTSASASGWRPSWPTAPTSRSTSPASRPTAARGSRPTRCRAPWWWWTRSCAASGKVDLEWAATAARGA
ncbi:MAG: AMP-binding protein [Acidimicrobiales bacterium]